VVVWTLWVTEVPVAVPELVSELVPELVPELDDVVSLTRLWSLYVR
jgi:hypothetical protein